MKFIICIDIDDTIEDLLKAWVAWLNTKHNLNKDYRQISNWDVSLFFPELNKSQVIEPLTLESFWKTVKPKRGAAFYIKKLINEGHNIYLCTATHYLNIKYKYKHVINKYFPFISWDKIIITQNKQLINCDIMIDDGPHNLINGNYIKILFDAPHNKQFIEKNYEILRVSNWKQIYNFIKNLTIRY